MGNLVLNKIEFSLPHGFEELTASSEDFFVEIFRRVRIEPFPGMQQPTRPGCFLGVETMMKILYRGKPAAGYFFKLIYDDVMEGITDENGISSVKMTEGDCVLEIHGPNQSRIA